MTWDQVVTWIIVPGVTLLGLGIAGLIAARYIP
jgi:hypothetical protein